ncbi:MAG: AAA family ATPase [Clostridia bacterium]|nr:AAA family ATPase [Clostridia bacterium]
MFEQVTRKKAKLRMALMGVSGAGKTLSALYIAYGITGDWSKVALIDTEHERARFYADRSDLGTGRFLYAPFTPPYSPERYKKYVEEGAEAVGEDGVIIIDSFSHAWNNEGGVLEIKDRIAGQQGKNSYTAWAEAGREQNSLVNTILAVNCHTIVTLRSKMDYIMQENDRGKMTPVKVGLAPIQRDDTEYEFDIVMSISRDHTASTSKDTTFLDNFNKIITPDLGKQLAEWLNTGAEPIRCESCGKVIMAQSGKKSNGQLYTRSVEEIINSSMKHLNKKLCFNCYSSEYKAKKEAEKDAAS